MMMTATASLSIGRTKKEQLTLIGRSRAGDGTCFAIPEFKWLFDCGARIQGWQPTTIFLSHTHSDHIHYLTHMKQDKKPPTVYLPKSAMEPMRKHLEAYDALTSDNSDFGDAKSVPIMQQYDFRPTDPWQEIIVNQGSRAFRVQTIECDHRKDCLGYSIHRQKQRLKEQYASLTGSQIAQLKKAGANIVHIEEEPLLCFLGDTTHLVFERHAEILDQHKLIIVECSFLDEKDVGRASHTRHMHWSNLEPIVSAHPHILFVLIHFSLKYPSVYLRKFFASYRNVHPLLIEDEVEREWKKSSKGDPIPTCGCFHCSDFTTSI